MNSCKQYNWFKANPDNFIFKEKEIAGDLCVLIIPKPGFNDWDSTNMIYRSSIWRVSDGTPVSIGYKKFTNIDEQPHFDPINNSSKFTLIEKIDGSCVIVSKYKDELIVRTRGSFDISSCENKDEIKQLYKLTDNFKKLFDSSCNTPQFSLMFEWVSPENTIIIKHKKPKFYLTGLIKHSDYTYAPQNILDFIAFNCDIPRPETITFEEKDGIDALKKYIQGQINTEGVVAYFDDDQVLKKFKSEWYLKLHHAKSFLSSIDNLLDWLYDNKFLDIENLVSEKDIKEKIEKDFDHEIMVYTSENLNVILTAFNIFYNNYNFAKNKIKDNNCQTAEDVLSLIENNPILSKDLIWPIFRNKKLSKIKLIKLIKSYI